MTNRETIELFDAEVVASEAALSRSKNIEKSAKVELEQHRRWLQRHAAAEARNRAKHQRRLKQLRISQRRWVKRQRFLRSVRQRAVIIGAAARSAALALGRTAAAAARSTGLALRETATSAATYARHQISSAVAWSRPRLRAAADASYVAGKACYAWLKIKASDASVQLSNAGKIAAARGHALAQDISRQGAAGFKTLSAKSGDLASRISKQSSSAFKWSRMKSNAAFAWSRTKGDVAFAWSRTKASALSRSASHAASIGFEQVKRTSGDLAQSASALSAATTVRARTYGNQAFSSAKSWSEKTAEGAQQLRESLAARATVSQLHAPSVPSPGPDEPAVAALEPQQRSVIDLLDITPQRAGPAETEPVPAPSEAQPRALAASVLTKPSPPRDKPKPGKIKAKDKTHRGGRAGKKKHKQKFAKSKSK